MTVSSKKPLAKIVIALLKLQLHEANQRIEQLERQRTRSASRLGHINALIVKMGWDGRFDPPLYADDRADILKLLIEAKGIMERNPNNATD
jgi:hypothetical protein